jgi:hypothetical protein
MTTEAINLSPIVARIYEKIDLGAKGIKLEEIGLPIMK